MKHKMKKKKKGLSAKQKKLPMALQKVNQELMKLETIRNQLCVKGFLIKY